MSPDLNELGADVAEATGAGVCVQCALQLGVAPETAVFLGVAIVMGARTALAVYRLWVAWKAARADETSVSRAPGPRGTEDTRSGGNIQPPSGLAGPGGPQ